MSREREEESEMVTATAVREPVNVRIDRVASTTIAMLRLLNPNRNQIARDSGLNRRHVGRIMLGQDRPRLDTAYRIATAMGVSLDQLYSLLSPLWAANREEDQ